MRLTLFISILSCLILLPCWLVMNHLKPPLNFISPGTTQRAAVGFVISIIIKFIANDKLTDDGHVAAIITGTLLTAASPVFIIGIGFTLVIIHSFLLITYAHWHEFEMVPNKEFHYVSGWHILSFRLVRWKAKRLNCVHMGSNKTGMYPPTDKFEIFALTAIYQRPG